MENYNRIFMASTLLLNQSECEQAELLIVTTLLFRQVPPLKKLAINNCYIKMLLEIIHFYCIAEIQTKGFLL